MKTGDYVRCKVEKRGFKVGRFYKILPASSLKNDKGQVVRVTLSDFEPLPPTYINAFK